MVGAPCVPGFSQGGSTFALTCQNSLFIYCINIGTMFEFGQIVINGKYNICSVLGEGAFGEVYRAKCVGSNDDEDVAIKCERVGLGGFSLLKREFHVYQWLRKNLGENPSFYPFPAVRLFHQEKDASFLVMDKCSISLMGIVQRQKVQAQGSGIVAEYLDYEGWCKFARRMIRMLEAVHLGGIVHRDIKPANFVLRNADCFVDDAESFLLLDFGLAAFYTDEPLVLCSAAQPPVQEKTKGLIGSINYASVNAHRRMELSRRDDLESLAYVLLYVWSVGSLPWVTCVSEAEVLEAKVNLAATAVGLPEALLQFLQYVRMLELHEAPSYRRMERYFQYGGELQMAGV